MRPYYPADPRRTLAMRGAFTVPASPCAVIRPNRFAAGLYATIERRKRRQFFGQPVDLKPDVLSLCVRGTLDPLAAGRFDLERVVCPCCGNKSDRLKLKAGAAKSRRLRIKAARAKRLRSASRLP
jgi:hypothetical protein